MRLLVVVTWLRCRALDLGGLRLEAKRRLDRVVKKVAAAEARPTDNVAALDAQRRDLEDLCVLLEEDVDRGVRRARELNVTDAPPPRPRPQKKTKKKQHPVVPAGQRKPYWRFRAVDGVEIRVGRSAPDNDLLSLEHRDPDDLWMHATGCAGSHVVVRSPAIDAETELDAACLAALFSKAVKTKPPPDQPHKASGRATVTVCRAGSVTKPPLAKPGLVQIIAAADVRAVQVDLDAEHDRLRRLLATKQL